MTVINQDKSPEMNISMYCNKPYDCPLKKECWGTLPKNNVLQLTNWRVYWKLLNDNILDIKDIPEGTKLNLKDEIIIESITKSPHIAKEHITQFISSLNYPLYHFDFETFDTAIPIYDKSKPYQKIPFQYSLHIEQEDGSIEHKEFLSERKEANCKSKVLLPIPGSPATRTNDPETIPPPRTRSNSPIPVFILL